MTRCRNPNICEKYRVDIGIYDPKSERILPRNVKQKDICVHIHENHYCVNSKKRKDALLNGEEEVEKKFNFVKNQIKEDNLSQRISYKITQLETID